MEWVIGCLLVITIIAVYFPIAYLRLTNKVLKVMEQIEINTRK
jgi:hypothetical protein